MRKPYTQLFVHLVWATWDRLPLIDPALRPRIYRCIQAEAFKLGCEVGAIGGIEDHVHVLARCSPAVSVSNLVKQIKGSSSRLVQRELRPGEFFKSHQTRRRRPRSRFPSREFIRHGDTGRLDATLERTFIDD